MSNLKFKGCDVSESGGGNAWRALAYTCPSCDAVLSVQIDPIAIKTDTVKAIKGR
jgi:hypothetical protein